MDPESVFPASTAASQGVDLYHALGGMDTCRELSAAFYAHVEHDPVLRPLYPPTLKGVLSKRLLPSSSSSSADQASMRNVAGR